MMDNPGQLGADQVADAVAGIAGYPVPLILIDMGTATTASVVNSKKQYVGGMILPGVGVSLDALTARASQLSGISIDAPRHVIGKNTIECMKSGVLLQQCSSSGWNIDRIEEELGEKATVVATGGLGKEKSFPIVKEKSFWMRNFFWVSDWSRICSNGHILMGCISLAGCRTSKW